jgi:hypothetical protein
MDIWHTCEPEKVGNEGWVGRAIRDLDPKKENVLTGVNFGRGLPRAMAVAGVPVASVGNLETYGVLTGIEAEDQRVMALETFSRTYEPMLGKGPVLSYFAQTGLDALKGADILSTALDNYSSTVKYGNDDVAQYMKNIVQTNLETWGSGYSTPRPRTTASIPTPESWRTIPACGPRRLKRSLPSTMISKSTMLPTMWCSLCSPNSAGVCMTTVLGLTTAQAVTPSSSAMQ